MNDLKKHIVFRVFTLLLVAALLLPASIKMVHIFQHHNHEVCNGDSTTHLHKVDLDCDFQKFQIYNYFTFSDLHFQLFSPTETSEKQVSFYQFLSKYQRLHFSLRGPPVLI
ncbi:hypothetical protein WJN01_12255 [Flavobacteriaceae bacterium SZ-1-7]|uniref:hypothetical protein n=1 Tax=Tamlana sedimenti TaxID=3134126 RepID=UPI0031221520